MANHDFGSPCDCRECRTTMFSVPCPSCGFETTLSYERGSNGISIDRKGIRDYDFIKNTSKGHALNCFKCGFEIKDVSYYEKVEDIINQTRLNERICEECEIKEFNNNKLGKVQYKEINGKLICMDCFELKIKSEFPDPTTPDKKFILNLDKLQYELYEVRLPCKDCGRKRWVKANEQWKKQCLSCYIKTKENENDIVND